MGVPSGALKELRRPRYPDGAYPPPPYELPPLEAYEGTPGTPPAPIPIPMARMSCPEG